MTYCKACPIGTNTTRTGSTSISDCVAQAKITGIVPSSDFSVKENGTISIVCNVDGSPAPTTTWTKTTGSPPSSDRVAVNYIYDLEGKLTGVEYVIAAAIASDTGTYECKAYNKINVATKTINVSVTS